MARGTTLLVLRTMLKGEIGHNLQSGVATAQDAELNQILSDIQQWLWNKHLWYFLYTHEDIAAAISTRYYTNPSTVSLDKPTQVESKWGNIWYPVDYGIHGEQYIQSDPDRSQVLDPIRRWQVYSSTQIEVWPVPATAQTLRFWGTRILTGFKTAGAFDDTKTADLDDLLIVYYAAAEKLKRMKQADWQDKLAKGQELYNDLRAVNAPDSTFIMSQSDFDHTPPNRRVITAIGNTNH